MHIKHHYAATTLAVVFLVAMVVLVASKYQFANNQVSSTNSVLSTYQNAQNALSNKASTLAQSVSTLSSKLTSSNATIQTDANEIASLQSELSAAESKVSSLSTDAAAIASMNSSLQMYKSFYTSQISTISAQLTQIASLNSKISQLSVLINHFTPLLLTNLDNILPASFNTTGASSWTKYSMLNSVSYNGSDLFMIGGKNNSAAETPTSIGALYNPSSNKFTDLSSLFSAYPDIYLMATASNGGTYLIAAATPAKSPSGFHADLLMYNNGAVSNLTSALPSGSDFFPEGMAYGNGTYLITGFYQSSGSTNFSPVLFAYSTAKGLTNLTSEIPSSLKDTVFLSVAYDGSDYGILDVNFSGGNVCAALYNCSWNKNNPSPNNVNIVMYNPLAKTFTTYKQNLSNWFNGGISWDGAKFLVVNAVPGGFTTGMFSPDTFNYTPIINAANESPGVPGQGIAWNGYEFFIPGLGPNGNGQSPFLFSYS